MRPDKLDARLLPIRFIQTQRGTLQAKIPVNIPHSVPIEPTTLQYALDWMAVRIQALKKELSVLIIIYISIDSTDS